MRSASGYWFGADFFKVVDSVMPKANPNLVWTGKHGHGHRFRHGFGYGCEYNIVKNWEQGQGKDTEKI